MSVKTFGKYIYLDFHDDAMTLGESNAINNRKRWPASFPSRTDAATGQPLRCITITSI